MPPKVSRITFEGYLFFSNISHYSDAEPFFNSSSIAFTSDANSS